jgi:hypothetical protein
VIGEKIVLFSGGLFFWGYIQGEGRNQGTLFSVVLDDFVSADHVRRVIEVFVELQPKYDGTEDGIPSGNYMVDGVGQPGVVYFARFAA